MHVERPDTNELLVKKTVACVALHLIPRACARPAPASFIASSCIIPSEVVACPLLYIYQARSCVGRSRLLSDGTHPSAVRLAAAPVFPTCRRSILVHFEKCFISS